MKRLTIYLLSLFVLLLNITAENSKGEVRVVAHYADLTDLSSSRVDGAVQDRRGLMWFATWNGLDCFDGYDFHWMKFQPGDGVNVADDRIREIRLSKEGNILCFTDNGVFMFDLTTYRFRSLPEAEQRELMKGGINVKWGGMRDRQGNFWTADLNGIYKATHPHHPAQVVEETRGQHVRALFIDKEKRVWMGSRNQKSINIFNQQGTLLKTINVGQMVFRITQLRNGDIWLGTKPANGENDAQNLLKLNTTTLTIEKTLPVREVYDIEEDEAGQLWIASFRDGVVCCPNPQAAAPTLIKQYGGTRVRRILLTPSGNIIAATSRGLLVGKLDFRDAKRVKLRPIMRDGNDAKTIASNTIMDLLLDKRGNIFISTASSGIDRITEEDLMNSKKPVFQHFSTLTSSLITDFSNAMTFYNDSTLLVVGNNNMMLFNPYSDHTVNYNSVFFSDSCRFSEATPLRLNNGSWILGTEKGAYLVLPKNLETRGYIPPMIWTYVVVNGGAHDYTRTQTDTLTLKPGEHNITIGYAALDYVNNSGILYRTRLDKTPWTGNNAVRNISLFDLKPGTYTLQVQSTDRYGRWVNNVKTLCIIVEPYWYETWWARTFFILLIIGGIGCVIFNIFYIRHLKQQRQESLEKYMALLARDEDKKTLSDEQKTQRFDIQEQKAEDTAMEQFTPADQDFLNRLRRFIEENIHDDSITVDDMAAATATSRSTLNRRLRSLLGITATQLLTDARLQHAMQLLKNNPNISVADVAYKSGYADPRYFSRCFKQKYGMSPSSLITHNG